MTYDLYSGGALAEHAEEIGYWTTLAENNPGDTDAASTALAEIDTLMRKLAYLRMKLTGDVVPDPVAYQRLLAPLLALPAELDSVLLGEFHHTRPAGGVA